LFNFLGCQKNISLSNFFLFHVFTESSVKKRL